MNSRLLAFFQHMPPYSGAAALRGQSIIRGLVNCGFQDIRVFTSTPLTDTLLGAQIVTVGNEVENALGLARRMLGELWLGWVAARAMFSSNGDSGRSRVALVSSPAYLTALVICARARWSRIPYVLELRDVYPQVYAEAGLLGRGSMLYRFLAARSSRMYRGASLVIVATHGLAKEVAEVSGATPVTCVYNGFPSALMARGRVKHTRFTVCFHGVLGFFQDVETLVEVARALQAADVDFLTIGYGRKEHVLRQANLPNLKFLGRLSFEDTMAQVERCHLGLCLRLDDGISKDAFPVKVWEYLGLGIPSVVTPPCEAGHFLQEHACGMQFKTGDVQAIVDAVLMLKNDPLQMAAMTQRCQTTRKNFTREQTGLAAAQLIQRAARDIRPR